MSNPTAKELLVNARSAEAEKRLQDAIMLYTKLMELRPEHITARASLARLLKQQGQYEKAVAQWTEVANRCTDHKSCWLELGRLYQQTQSIENAIAAYLKFLENNLEHHESVKAVDRLQNLSRYANAQPNFNLKHIAIAGVSYSGSTLLAALLGGFSGVENAGETSWLIRRKVADDRLSIDFERDDLASLPHCLHCGSKCEAFNIEFRKKLQSNPLSWHHKIAQRLSCDCLVTADKNYGKLNNLDPLLRFDIIVLFKNPLQAWYSNYKKLLKPDEAFSPVADIQTYLRKWTDEHSRFIHRFENQGKKLFLDFEKFCHSPAAHLEKLCDIFNLPFDESVLRQAPAGQHAMGGNSQFNHEIEKKEKLFSIRPLPPVDLPQESIELIEVDVEANAVYIELQRLYRAVFQDCIE